MLPRLGVHGGQTPPHVPHTEWQCAVGVEDRGGGSGKKRRLQVQDADC